MEPRPAAMSPGSGTRGPSTALPPSAAPLQPPAGGGAAEGDARVSSPIVPLDDVSGLQGAVERKITEALRPHR